jgi:hypothetical protein
MGQYYILYNWTRKQTVKPAFANWKIGEYDWDRVLLVMGWSRTDQLIAIGDYGDAVLYDCPFDQEPEWLFELDARECTDRYICNVTGKEVDHEYSFEEWAELKTGNKVTRHDVDGIVE